MNTLLDQVVADEEPMQGIGEEALQAEVEARRRFREEHGAKKPSENVIAKLSGLGERAFAARVRKQKKRRKAAEAAQKKRVEAKRKLDEAAFKAVKDKAYSTPPPESRDPWEQAGSKQSSRFGGFGRNAEVAKHYKALDLPYGAPFAEVKSAYRKLMRKYHPDLHNDSPKKQKAANELSVRVTQAYNALEKHLEG